MNALVLTSLLIHAMILEDKFLEERSLGYSISTVYVKMKVNQSCLTLCDSHGLYSPWNSPGQNTGVGSLSLLQGIFPTQGSNPGLPHCRWILYWLSHKGSPYLLTNYSLKGCGGFHCYQQRVRLHFFTLSSEGYQSVFLTGWKKIKTMSQCCFHSNFLSICEIKQ